MGFFHPGVPPYMLEWGVTSLPAGAAAIETGTYMGDSADVLHRVFGRCITIEKSPTLAEQATIRFEGVPGVSVLQGSSRERLGEALEAVHIPPFVWLDAHWSGGITAGSDDPCPVLDEVRGVAARFPAAAVVLVDDARIFGAADPDDQVNSGWPSLLDVLMVLREAGWVTFVMDDVIAGIPPALAASFAALTRDSSTAKIGTLTSPGNPGTGHQIRRRVAAMRDSILSRSAGRAG